MHELLLTHLIHTFTSLTIKLLGTSLRSVACKVVWVSRLFALPYSILACFLLQSCFQSLRNLEKPGTCWEEWHSVCHLESTVSNSVLWELTSLVGLVCLLKIRICCWFSSSSQQWPFLCSVFIKCFQVTNPNNGDISASLARCLTHHNWTLNCTVAPIVFKITPRQGPRRIHSLYCSEGAFTAPLHGNGSYSIVVCVFVAAGICLRAVAQQWTTILTLLFRLSGVMSQYCLHRQGLFALQIICCSETSVGLPQTTRRYPRR
jgi:hypothetical protein